MLVVELVLVFSGCDEEEDDDDDDDSTAAIFSFVALLNCDIVSFPDTADAILCCLYTYSYIHTYIQLHKRIARLK